MEPIRGISRLFSQCLNSVNFVPVAGLKSFKPYVKRTDIEYPERPKLKIMEKVPQYPPGMRPFKMQKRLKFMRGPEEGNDQLLHKQFGVVARGGGRLKYGHLEMIRITLLRNLDFNKVFAIWRVQAPWQPVTKKSQGQRMGGGKGPIDFYVTPVKAERIIFELGGDCEFFEVEKCLKNIAAKLPFKADAVSQETLDARRAEDKRLEEENLHPWTWKYMIQNNMLGCHKWISPYDKKWFNKYL